MTNSTVRIVRRADKSLVEATLVEGVRAVDLTLIEREWTPERSQLMQALMQRGVPRVKWPQSLQWDWTRKAPQLQLLETSGFGLICEKQWQGVMLTKTASHVARLPQDGGKPLVYIDFLESAPRNWPIPDLSRDGEFGGIGPFLFWRAAKQSEEEGFHGRVGLHALPQAEKFYEIACGMTPLGRDAKKENLTYFELSRSQAKKILQEGGQT